MIGRLQPGTAPGSARPPQPRASTGPLPARSALPSAMRPLGGLGARVRGASPALGAAAAIESPAAAAREGAAVWSWGETFAALVGAERRVTDTGGKRRSCTAGGAPADPLGAGELELPAPAPVPGPPPFRTASSGVPVAGRGIGASSPGMARTIGRFAALRTIRSPGAAASGGCVPAADGGSWVGGAACAATGAATASAQRPAASRVERSERFEKEFPMGFRIGRSPARRPYLRSGLSRPRFTACTGRPRPGGWSSDGR